MKKRLTIYITILLLIPTLVVTFIINLSNNNSVDYEVIKDKKNNHEIIPAEKDITIKINKNNNIVAINLEEYIIGVVAGEMPASFEDEALKAQAIASRTYAIYKIYNNKNNYDIETTINDQVYITKDEMKQKWNNEYDLYYNKIKNAVNSTKNMVMKKNNEIFKAYYFSMSNGYTEDSISVFGENTTKSVKSPWDNEDLNKFTVTTTFSKENIKSNLNINENTIKITILERGKTNRVEKIQVNNKIYTGIEFRKLLNLRSTDFTIEVNNNEYLITTKGNGHGVGLSQYGANGMAKENYTYKEILEYYYQDIEITNI